MGSSFSLLFICSKMSRVLPLVTFLFLVEKFCLICTWCIFNCQFHQVCLHLHHSSVHSFLVTSLLALLFIAHFVDMSHHSLTLRKQSRNSETSLGRKTGAYGTYCFFIKTTTWVWIPHLISSALWSPKGSTSFLSLLQESAESVLPPPPCPMRNPNGKWKMQYIE